MREKKNACRTLVGNPEEKRPLGRPRCRWENNNKWALEKLDEVVRTELIWLRIGNEFSGSIKFWEVLGQLCD
jgi:hypothetical protein